MLALIKINMRKILIIVVIFALVLSCSIEKKSQNNMKGDSENVIKESKNIIFAFTYQWSFDMELIAMHKFEDNQVENANILQIQYENGRPQKIIWLNNKQPIQMAQMGKDVYSINFEYSKNLMTQTYLNKKNEPVNDMFGICRIITKFDDEGNKILQSYFDVNSKNVKDEYGNYQYSFSKGKTDKKRISFALDNNGERIEFAEGGYQIDYILDDHDVIIENIWKDINGNITTNKYGYAISTLSFDNKYQLLEMKYLDKNNASTVKIPDNYAYYKCKYDDSGNLIEKKYFNANNELTIDSISKCAIMKVKWKGGQPVSIEKFDVNVERIY